MIAAKEVFQDYAKEAPTLQRKILGMPVNYTRFFPTSKQYDGAIVATCAVLGFLVTPSYRLWARAIGAFLASNVGLNSGQYVTSSRQNAACVAVAKVLAKDFKEVPAKTLRSISERCGLKVEQLPLLLGDLYLTFLEACLEVKSIHTGEFSQLKKLKGILQLSSSEVGTQVLKAARHLESSSQYPKFVFLAERILRDDTKEGYAYESMRAQKELGVNKDEWLKIAEKAAAPFYENALRKAVIEGQPVSPSQLKEIRVYLGISDKHAEKLHQACLDDLSDREHLLRARNLLNM